MRLAVPSGGRDGLDSPAILAGVISVVILLRKMIASRGARGLHCPLGATRPFGYLTGLDWTDSGIAIWRDFSDRTMYAIISDSGRQIKVEQGQELLVDYRDVPAGQTSPSTA
jgi:hypothetical protein